MKRRNDLFVSALSINPVRGTLTLTSVNGEELGAFLIEPDGCTVHFEGFYKKFSPKLPARDPGYYDEVVPTRDPKYYDQDAKGRPKAEQEGGGGV